MPQRMRSWPLLLLGASVASCLRLTPPAPGAGLRFVPATAPYEDDARFPEAAEPGTGARRVWGSPGPPGASSLALRSAKVLLRGENLTRETPPWMPWRDPYGLGPWAMRLLVWPAGKFAFCYIEKVAGTQFNILMNVLNGLEYGTTSLKYPHCESSWIYKEVPWDNITRAQGWKTGIFFRDPAERLLSAWRSKCQVWEENGTHCLGLGRTDAAPAQGAEAFERMVSDFLPGYIAQVKQEGFWNSHYDPQHLFCGDRRIEDYDFVGRLSGDHAAVHKQVMSMFTSVAAVPTEGPAYAAFWRNVSAIFPAAGMGGHDAGKSHFDASHVTGSSVAMADYYRSPGTYEAAVRAYAEDYERLGFARGRHEAAG